MPFSVDLSDGRSLWIWFGEERYKVMQLPVKFSVENQFHEIPLICFAYQQEFNDGVLAWTGSAKETIEGQVVDIQLVFKPDQAGFLRLDSIQYEGIQQLSLFLSKDKDTLSKFVAQHFRRE